MLWIETIQPWQWMVFGIVLLIFETLGVGGFLIGVAIASVIQSVIAFVWPNLSWGFQLFLFAFNAILFTVLYWKFFKSFNNKTDQENINNRAAQLIGRKLTIEQDFENGEGKVFIGDTSWRFTCDTPLSVGDKVEVTGSQEMTIVLQRQSN